MWSPDFPRIPTPTLRPWFRRTKRLEGTTLARSVQVSPSQSIISVFVESLGAESLSSVNSSTDDFKTGDIAWVDLTDGRQ